MEYWIDVLIAYVVALITIAATILASWRAGRRRPPERSEPAPKLTVSDGGTGHRTAA